ncbi:MAG: hypothetical protein AABW56_04590 [Nanoarchaeota archaeon]
MMKKIIMPLLIGTSLLLSPKAKSQVDGSIEGIKSFEPKQSYMRPSTSYKLPLELEGFSFMEFYQDESYFGKTTLDKSIVGDLGVTGQAIHGSGFDDKYGIGLSQVISTSEKAFLKVHVYPLWIDSKGKSVKDGTTLGYFGSLKLPFDLELSSFGDWKIGPKGLEWDYGEISLEKKLTDKLSASYIPALKSKDKGGAIPRLEQRIGLKYQF